MALAGIDTSRVVYKIKDKLHYALHLAEEVRQNRLNPKLACTMGGEDFVGQMSAIGSAVHNRVGGRRMLERWALRLQLHLLQNL